MRGLRIALAFSTEGKMPTAWAYISEKVTDDDVPAARLAAKAKAITQLGSPNVELYVETWVAKDLCTTWRLCTPDPPPNP